uniref:protein-tyrosine-phosphatase n=1 Tax=Eptatretus burgeri TaxID=7764 RepID=A0A8C4WYI2_EPTBU
MAQTGCHNVCLHVYLVIIFICFFPLSNASSRPTLVIMPKDQIGVDGGVASFVCHATGEPRPNITWNKRGRRLNSQRIEVIEFDRGAGSVLRIQPLRPQRDEAVYECLAANINGKVSAEAKLFVLKDDQLPAGFPRIHMPPQLKVVERTRTANMMCGASGNPDPTIVWFKDFLPVDVVKVGNRVKQMRTGALQIEDSDDSDQGKYECVASNSAGTVYSSPANLYVRVRHVPPRFSIPPKNHEIMPGGSVNLTCVAVGSPMPYVKWTLGPEELTPEADMPVGRNVLALDDVTESANYTCVAMSSLGVIEMTAQVTVKALPRPPTKPVVTETTATSVTMTWDSGNSEHVKYYTLSYRQRLVGADGRPQPPPPTQDVDGVGTTRYTVGGLMPFSEYDFQVSAVNSVGRGPASESVLASTGEQVPSSSPRNVQAQMLSASTMLVSWEEPLEPNGQIRGYRVYYTANRDTPVNTWDKHNVDDSLLTTISKLIPQSEYLIRVLAFTSVGDGPLSAELHACTKQGVPGQPMNLKAEADSATAVLLSWMPPSHDGIVKYELYYREGEHENEKEQMVMFNPSMTYLLEGLRPNTLYNFRLAARSKQGVGATTPTVSVRTRLSTPSAAPQSVTCKSISSTSLLVHWSPPPSHAQNGPIVRYGVRYYPLNRPDDVARTDLLGTSPDEESRLLQGLEKWTDYRVAIIAYTAVGPGPESQPCTARTFDDVPSGAPRRISVKPQNSTAVLIRWRAPPRDRHHGTIRGYQVHLSRMAPGMPPGHPRMQDIMLPDSQRDDKDHEVIIGNLLPETTYVITMAAYTARGDGVRSKSKVFTTPGAVPSRPRLSVSYTQANTALVQWQQPSETHGPILGYRLRFGREDSPELTSLKFEPSDDNYAINDGLYRGATFIFRLSAQNHAGFGEEATRKVHTPEAIPSGYPQKLHAVAKTATGIQVAWDPPLLPERNGRILKYSVSYSDIHGADEQVIKIVSAQTECLLSGLQSDTTYNIRVRAHTSVGEGPYSPAIQERTGINNIIGRDFVKNFQVSTVTSTSALLSWELPHRYKIQQPFKIKINSERTVEVENWSTRKLITGLKPSTQYYFGLTRRGDGAGGLQQEVRVTTAPSIVLHRPIVQGSRTGGTLLTLLPDVPRNIHVQAFYVVVVPLKHRHGRHLKPSFNPEDMDLDELLGPHRRHRKRRALRNGSPAVDPQPYVAAQFKGSLPKQFTLGDEQDYSGYLNRRLADAHGYTFFLLTELDKSETARMFVASPFSELIIAPNPAPSPITEEEEGLLWVVGPVLAVVFIICIVIAILLYKRKRSDSDPGKPILSGHKDQSPHHPSDPVELRRMNCQTPGMVSHPPIPVGELADHVERLKANDNLKFSQEYESIDPGQQFTWDNSNLDVNKPKNRYANVIAYDHSRVILAPLEAVPGSDYINANYMDGYRRQNAYIATQGPLPETFADFWRMVWEQRSATVVMMTKLEERCRVKCDQYWPSRGTETYGLVQVTLLDTMELATYAVRTFALQKAGSNEKREVRHFQFTAWPDHGVPEYPTPFLAFLRRVKACNPPDAGPMVVHCSAGVGRTGCFIVIDAMLERLRQEHTVDVYGHVTCLRAQRNYMVQTEEQYAFIHESLLEAAAAGCTEVPARSLYAHLQRLTAPGTPGEGSSGMELEFKRLASAKASTLRFISANLPCNKFKNRLVNIMPYESTRVALQPIRGVEGSDYINASFIDGYRQQAAYIGTQGPLAETTEDFWRMLWEHNSTIVVMLTKLRELGQEKCHQYWPAERSARYQYFVVDPMAEYSMPQYILREFKVTDARDGQSRTIRQFQFIDWPEQGVPKSGEGFIDFIGQVHKTKEQFGQDGPITVHCSAGVGRTGVFVTLSIVLERMRYEGVVDVFQTVKMLRTQRPAMVQTEDQYQFCYRAALEYLGSFDHYAT